MKSKNTAAILAFLFGGTGAHLFYLGRNKSAIAHLVLLLIAIPLIIVYPFGSLVVSGILGILVIQDIVIILTMDDNKFNETYNPGMKPGNISNVADEIKKLYDLKESNVLTQEEFDKKKAELLK